MNPYIIPGIEKWDIVRSRSDIDPYRWLIEQVIDHVNADINNLWPKFTRQREPMKLTYELLTSKRRFRECSLARNIFCFIMEKIRPKGMTQTDIAKMIGCNNHSDHIHNDLVCRSSIRTYTTFKNSVSYFVKSIGIDDRIKV